MLHSHLNFSRTFGLAFAICCAQISPCAAVAPSQNKAENLVMKELRLLTQLMVTPDSATIDAISRNFGFSYRQGECRQSNKTNLCTYEIDSQASKVGRIMLLELGEAKTGGSRTGRLIWVPWDEKICLTPVRLANLLGEGHVSQLSTAYFEPGGNQNSKSQREIKFANIPGAAEGAIAAGSFYGQCLLELTVSF